MSIMMIPRILAAAMIWLRETKPFKNASFLLKQTGLEFSMRDRGNVFLLPSSRIGAPFLLWNSFVRPLIHQSLLSTILKFVIDMLANLSDWIIKINSTIHIGKLHCTE